MYNPTGNYAGVQQTCFSLFKIDGHLTSALFINLGMNEIKNTHTYIHIYVYMYIAYNLQRGMVMSLKKTT